MFYFKRFVNIFIDIITARLRHHINLLSNDIVANLPLAVKKITKQNRTEQSLFALKSTLFILQILEIATI